MEDALDGWTRAALARATTKAIAAASGGRGPRIAAGDFRVWELKGPREDGMIDFELTIALPDGAERTFWGYNRVSRHAPPRTVEEVAALLAGDVMQTLEAAPALAEMIGAVTRTVEKVFSKPDYADLGVTLITVRPMTLPMENVVPPHAVTVVVLMRDERLNQVSSEFDTTFEDEVEELLAKWLPEQRRRFRRYELLKVTGADGIVDDLTMGVLALLGSSPRAAVRAMRDRTSTDLGAGAGSAIRHIRLRFLEGELTSRCWFEDGTNWDRNRIVIPSNAASRIQGDIVVGSQLAESVDIGIASGRIVMKEVSREDGTVTITIAPGRRFFKSRAVGVQGDIFEQEAAELRLGEKM